MVTLRAGAAFRRRFLQGHVHSSGGTSFQRVCHPAKEAMPPRLRFVALSALRVQFVKIRYGDIRPADFEEELTQFWSECLQRKAKGFRGEEHRPIFQSRD